MKIGVSSQNFRTITGHAGKGRRFFVYSVDKDGNFAETDRLDFPKEMAMHNMNPNDPHPLDQLDVLVTGSCGAGFYHKLAARNVQVIATSETDPVTAVKTLLEGKPLPPAEPHDHGTGGHHHH